MILCLKTNTKFSHSVDHRLTGNVSLDNGYIIYKYIYFLFFNISTRNVCITKYARLYKLSNGIMVMTPK